MPCWSSLERQEIDFAVTVPGMAPAGVHAMELFRDRCVSRKRSASDSSPMRRGFRSISPGSARSWDHVLVTPSSDGFRGPADDALKRLGRETPGQYFGADFPQPAGDPAGDGFHCGRAGTVLVAYAHMRCDLPDAVRAAGVDARALARAHGALPRPYLDTERISGIATQLSGRLGLLLPQSGFFGIEPHRCDLAAVHMAELDRETVERRRDPVIWHRRP